MKNLLCESLGVGYTTNHGDCLGLPSIIGRKKSEIFTFIKEKSWHRTYGWRHKILSRAGNEILLEAVVQGLPSNVRVCFLYICYYVRIWNV